VAEGRLQTGSIPATITYHDPCYLGRHNGVYDEPRNLLKGIAGEFVELERKRENSFCCGAGGAQFWKEEEAGEERVSANRYREVERSLRPGTGSKVLAVGCPFCKSMLNTASAAATGVQIEVKDVAELLLQGVEQKLGKPLSFVAAAAPAAPVTPTASAVQPLSSAEPAATQTSLDNSGETAAAAEAPPLERKKWSPVKAPLPPSIAADHAAPAQAQQEPSPAEPLANAPKPPAPRKPWKPNS
jgi:hypothetical protein